MLKDFEGKHTSYKSSNVNDERDSTFTSLSHWILAK